MQSLTEIEFEALLIMGQFIRLPYSRQWVIAGDLFGAMQTSNHKQEPNLKLEFDMLITTKDIRPGEQLVAPAEIDADRHWKNRVFKSGGWQRQNDRRPAKPTLKQYLKYVERVG